MWSFSAQEKHEWEFLSQTRQNALVRSMQGKRMIMTGLIKRVEDVEVGRRKSVSG